MEEKLRNAKFSKSQNNAQLIAAERDPKSIEELGGFILVGNKSNVEHRHPCRDLVSLTEFGTANHHAVDEGSIQAVQVI